MELLLRLLLHVLRISPLGIYQSRENTVVVISDGTVIFGYR